MANTVCHKGFITIHSLVYTLGYCEAIVSIDHTAAAKSLQSCPTLCNAIDGSPPGSAVPGILQARTLEWVAISFSIYSHYQSVNERKECLKNQNGTRPLTHKIYFGIILAPDDSSQAIK